MDRRSNGLPLPLRSGHFGQHLARTALSQGGTLRVYAIILARGSTAQAWPCKTMMGLTRSTRRWTGEACDGNFFFLPDEHFPFPDG